MKERKANQIRDKLYKIYKILYSHFGSQHWWPGESKFEVAIGAILTQNTNWRNVRKAILNLKKENVLSVNQLNNIPVRKLGELIRPAGYYNVKAKRLKNFLRFFIKKYRGRFALLAKKGLNESREELLDINGIGPETADSILLYAMEKAVFVVDAYTKRILIRHKLIDKRASYYDIQNFFMDNLPHDVKLFNEYHALIVKLGKDICKTRPLCEVCPLRNRM